MAEQRSPGPDEVRPPVEENDPVVSPEVATQVDRFRQRMDEEVRRVLDDLGNLDRGPGRPGAGRPDRGSAAPQLNQERPDLQEMGNMFEHFYRGGRPPGENPGRDPDVDDGRPVGPEDPAAGGERRRYTGEMPDATRYNGTMQAAVQTVYRRDQAGGYATNAEGERIAEHSVVHYNVNAVRSLQQRDVLERYLKEGRMNDPRWRSAVNNMSLRVVEQDGQQNLGANIDINRNEIDQTELLQDPAWWLMAARTFLSKRQDSEELAQQMNRGQRWDFHMRVRIGTKEAGSNFVFSEEHDFWDLLEQQTFAPGPDGRVISAAEMKKMLQGEIKAAFQLQNRRSDFERAQQQKDLDQLTVNPTDGYYLTSKDEAALGISMGMDGNKGVLGDLATHAESLYYALAHSETQEMVVVGPSGKEYRLHNYMAFSLDEDYKEHTQNEIKAFLRDELGGTEMEVVHGFFRGESYAKIHGTFDYAGAKNPNKKYKLEQDFQGYTPTIPGTRLFRKLFGLCPLYMGTAQKIQKLHTWITGKDVTIGHETGAGPAEQLMYPIQKMRTDLAKSYDEEDAIGGKTSKARSAGYPHFWQREHEAMPEFFLAPVRKLYSFGTWRDRAGGMHTDRRTIEQLLLPAELGGAGLTRQHLLWDRVKSAVGPTSIDRDFEEFQGRAANLYKKWFPRDPESQMKPEMVDAMQGDLWDNVRNIQYTAYILARGDMNMANRILAIKSGDELIKEGKLLMRHWMREYIEAVWPSVSDKMVGVNGKTWLVFIQKMRENGAITVDELNALTRRIPFRDREGMGYDRYNM